MGRPAGIMARMPNHGAVAVALAGLALALVLGLAVVTVGLTPGPASGSSHHEGLLDGLLGRMLSDDAADRGPERPVFAAADPVGLRLPSRRVEMVGFHEAGHDGARAQVPRDAGPPSVTMSSRGRPTAPRTAADVVAAPGEPVRAPVTGRVVRAGSYALYCRVPDHYVVIEPDARPGWEVKVLHFRGLQVEAGDRVVASRTVLGTEPRRLPLASQVDDYSRPRDWPHVHVEVVDPAIPDRGGGGC